MISVLSLAAVSCVFAAALSDDARVTTDWPVGDPRLCQEQAREHYPDLRPFEILPGIGWDNLRNLEAGQIVVYNYSRCQVTSDGLFLLPDNVFTVPIKVSEMETYAKLIDDWHDSTSLTSDSINVHSGFDQKFRKISGKFSREHEQMKARQIEDKASTIRIQLRYKKYEAKLQPNPVLSPQFKYRLLLIAARLELDQIDLARYEAELVVRDFGTHVLTSLTAGAALVKDDYLKREFVAAQRQDKTAILTSASVSFGHTFSLDSEYGHKKDKNMSDKYSKSLTHSSVRSLGGPLTLTTNMTVTEWTQQVDPNLVAMDRAGDPLYFLITPATLPELPPNTVSGVEMLVRQATEIYYQMNVIPGCTKMGSAKFSVSANFDDGSCSATPTNNTFGGVFQKCQVIRPNSYDNPCQGLDQVNPKTGQYSCPPFYEAIKLRKASKRGKSKSIKRCKKCGVFKQHHCCHTDQYQATAYYETYWCAATGPVKQESGYRFGGVFTTTTDNLVTGDRSCPPGYHIRQMFTHLSVCISDDFELDTAFSVPFGGFFSCTQGNPLAVKDAHRAVKPDPAAKTERAKTLEDFASKFWPKRCPEGYSAHLATEDAGCAIHYCVESGALTGPAMPRVKRPPFVQKPELPVEVADNLVMFDLETQTWIKNTKARDFLKQIQVEDDEETAERDGHSSDAGKTLRIDDPRGSDDGSFQLSVQAASGISVGVTLALVGMVTLAVYTCRRSQWFGAVSQSRYRNMPNNNEREVVLEQRQDRYGAIPGDQGPGDMPMSPQEDVRSDAPVNVRVEA